MAQSCAVSSGTIIILNGPSGAGKSTIQKAVQLSFDELYLSVGIDKFFDELLPDNYGQKMSESYDREVRRVVCQEGLLGPELKLEVGPIGMRAIRGMHRAFAVYAAEGNNLVADYIAYDKEWLRDLARVLKGYRVYLVGVTLPLEVLAERERVRCKTSIEHARSHYHQVHEGVEYDLMIDTSQLSPTEAAQRIKEHIKVNEPRALATLQ